MSKIESVLGNSSIHIRVGTQGVDLQQHDFLQFCWTGGLDTTCSVCCVSFNVTEAPPVRLLSLTRPTYASCATPGTLTISNFHLACLKRSKITFFPISHAWHPPIAEAYAMRQYNLAAAVMVYEMPFCILSSVIKRFGPGVQIWHDYLSIPQWQDDFRGTPILPQIFQIFENGSATIIHLDTEPHFQTPQELDTETSIVQSTNLRDIFGAHWFGRMWPVVEYDLSPTAFAMNKNYEIMKDSFPSVVKHIIDAHVNHEPADGMLLLQWPETLPLFLREKPKKKCLGYVYDMISAQGCRSHRDKFIASCALMRIEGYSSLLPTDTQEACLWVSEKCLLRNDFSPLLMAPSSEPPLPSCNWLRGHSSINSRMWGLGVETRAAIEPVRIRNHCVDLKGECLGTVSRFESWAATGRDGIFGFSNCLPFLTQQAGNCVSNLLQLVEAVYPSQYLWTQQDNINRFPGIRYKTPPLYEVESKLRPILNTLSSGDQEETPERIALLRTTISLLGLSSPPLISTAFQTLTRLQLYDRECPSSENRLLWVDCLACKCQLLLRASIWCTPSIDARVYRVPGLAYQKSTPEGMAIVVDNGSIIGRSRFAYRSCDCEAILSVLLC